MKRVDKKTCVITGAALGIGKACATQRPRTSHDLPRLRVYDVAKSVDGHDGSHHEGRRDVHPSLELPDVDTKMLRRLVDYLGWEDMGYRVPIRCFTHDPSISSSLKFLRKTPWARAKVEGLYLVMLREPRRGQRGP